MAVNFFRELGGGSGHPYKNLLPFTEAAEGPADKGGKKNKDSSVDFIVCGVTQNANSFISTRTASALGH